MATDPLWITEGEVIGAVDLARARGVVRDVLSMEAAGSARTLDKTALTWSGGTLHALGGLVEPLGLLGTKTWTHTAGGASPLLLLWDSDTGGLRAVIEAFALGQLRTASISAVATDVLADPDADLLAMIGTGKQALAQVAAVASVRALRQVRVFSPTAAHRAAFCARLTAHLPDLDVLDCEDLEMAVRSAPIVTTATRAREPFLEPEQLHVPTHVNALGAITRERAELTSRLVGAADVVASDAPAAAREQSSEVDGAPTVRALSELVAAGHTRTAMTSLTVFKAMGLGLADVAVGAEALRVVEERGGGTRMPAPTRQQPSLFDASMAARSTIGGST